MAPSSGTDSAQQLNIISFESFTVAKQIGAGSFAYVYKAQHPQLGHVALKVLMPRFATQSYQLGLFMQEASLLSTIRHRNIVECYGLCQIPAGCSAGGIKAPVATWGMVLEYCEGGTLAQRLVDQMVQPSSRVYSAMDALNWMIDIAHALDFLHSQMPLILHRDLKQENILISRDRTGGTIAKLVDFGLHKAVERARSTMLRSRDISQSSSARAGEPLDTIRSASGQLKSGGSGDSKGSGGGGASGMQPPGQLFFAIPPASAVQKKTRLGPGPLPDASLYATQRDVSSNGSSAASPFATANTPTSPTNASGSNHSATATTHATGKPVSADCSNHSATATAHSSAKPVSADGSNQTAHIESECPASESAQQMASQSASALQSAGSVGDARAAGGDGEAALSTGDKTLQVGVVLETLCPDEAAAQVHVAPAPQEGQAMLDVMEAGGLKPELDWQLVWALTGETGSPMYMAPEVTALLPYNEKVDIFSFGVIMYEVFTWALLRISHVRAMRTGFQSIDEYAAAVSKGYRPERSDLLSDRVWKLIQNCWSPDPCARSSTTTIISELEAERRAVQLAPPSHGFPSCQCTLS